MLKSGENGAPKSFPAYRLVLKTLVEKIGWFKLIFCARYVHYLYADFDKVKLAMN
jgi:hypothetical protein